MNIQSQYFQHGTYIAVELNVLALLLKELQKAINHLVLADTLVADEQQMFLARRNVLQHVLHGRRVLWDVEEVRLRNKLRVGRVLQWVRYVADEKPTTLLPDLVWIKNTSITRQIMLDALLPPFRTSPHVPNLPLRFVESVGVAELAWRWAGTPLASSSESTRRAHEDGRNCVSNVSCSTKRKSSIDWLGKALRRRQTRSSWRSDSVNDR